MSTRLAHYQVSEAIGAGSYATVHRAVDERLNDTVAIKILAENHSLNPEIRERFIAEGRSLRRVGGGHVVTVYDVGESDRFQPYLVLEFADRGTIRDRVEHLWRSGLRVGIDDALVFARQLAVAVAAVHQAGLVHRDLSPGNLLLTHRSSTSTDGSVTDRESDLIRADERLVLADLGMCKDLALNSGVTVSGGTEGFRPPEQDGPGIVDIRADIWAMSALLAWMLRGSDLPAPLNRVLKRGMSDRPKRRQPDARTWLQEVETALSPPEPEVPSQADEEGAEHSAHTDRSARADTPARPGRWARRIRWSLMSAALVIALAGGVLLGRWAFGDSGPPPAQIASSSIDISGPEEIEVGDPAVFSASTDGVNSWVWTLPNNRYVADQGQVTVTPTSPGTAVVVLRSQTPDGRELEVRHDIRVIE
ncbi:MAG: serine/threonine protein kinase [Brevibacterium sp.]|nr:serine/threonine protein kinase [Brevibacterium sp.]MDN6192363.1 serine/threonine protein kinase [Brevibacterium sp.]MDN6747306.1 serine/threonine protein kinase [Brevibacterium sp.]